MLSIIIINIQFSKQLYHRGDEDTKAWRSRVPWPHRAGGGPSVLTTAYQLLKPAGQWSTYVWVMYIPCWALRKESTSFERVATQSITSSISHSSFNTKANTGLHGIILYCPVPSRTKKCLGWASTLVFGLSSILRWLGEKSFPQKLQFFEWWWH